MITVNLFQKKHTMILAVFVLMVLLPTALSAQEAVNAHKTATPAVAVAATDKPTGEFAIAAMSQYFWRGYELSRNSIVVQPSVTIGYKGFSASLWGNIDTKPYFQGTPDQNYTSTINETDITLSYTRPLGVVNIGGGYIYYGLGPLNKDWPKRADVHELFAVLSFNTILSPIMTVYKDISHYRNWYFLFGVSHTQELTPSLSVKLEATAGYLLSTYADAALFNAGAGYGGYPRFNSSASATDEKFNNFHDGKITLSLPIKMTPHISLTPSLSYIFALSGDAKNEMKGQGLKGTASAVDRESTFILGGLTATLSF